MSCGGTFAAASAKTCTSCESCKATIPASVRATLRSPGQRLDGASRAFFEPRFGADLSSVRVHADAAAAQSAEDLTSLGYAAGAHVVFARGQYAPHTSAGRELLAHELAHVLQQRSGAAFPPGVSRADDPAERQADHVAAAALRAGGGAPPRVAHAGAPSTPPVPAPLRIQRKLRVSGTVLDAKAADRLANDLIKGELKDVVPKVVSAQLVIETIREMQRVSEVLDFAAASDVASDVRQRVLVSQYMRSSQGSSLRHKGFSYPNRPGDGTTGVGPKVNDDAAALWGSVQDASGSYFFDLSAAGLKNPYQALIKLFTEQTDPHKRTLIHCDYLVSVIEFRSFAENVGIERFNALVAVGALSAPGEPSMRLKWNGFADLLRLPAITLPLVGSLPVARNAPLHEVTLASKSDLVIGDHVKFYNHASYDTLTENVPNAIWRLENAIVIDRTGGRFRYQGHGYFTPVTEEVLLDGMIRQYNKHVEEAQAIVRRMFVPNAKAAAAAGAEKIARFPNVTQKLSGHGFEIRGEGFCGTTVARDLKPLTRAEAPGLIHPCSGKILARRPAETKP